MAVDKMILGTVKCTLCGAGYGKCDCWTKCQCGWLFETGTTCRNPKHGGDGQLSIVAEATDFDFSKL